MTPALEIYVRFQFEAFHRWPEAPPQHAYLASPHRHIFHCRVGFKVTHENRDLEFIELKRMATEVALRAKPKAETWSCETWARHLVEQLGAHFAEVEEDGENGARFSIV